MTRAAYNDFRGWKLPDNENGSDVGYLVRYYIPGQEEAVHLNWMTRSIFRTLYSPAVGMDFGEALKALQAGMKVQRVGWNGKGMFLFLVPGSTFKVNRPPLLGIYPEGHEINYYPHIDMKTADDKVVPWPASQTDILANDWQVIE